MWIIVNLCKSILPLYCMVHQFLCSTQKAQWVCLAEVEYEYMVEMTKEATLTLKQPVVTYFHLVFRNIQWVSVVFWDQWSIDLNSPGSRFRTWTCWQEQSQLYMAWTERLLGRVDGEGRPRVLDESCIILYDTLFRSILHTIQSSNAIRYCILL